jgi:hypothetical protein
MRYAVTVVSPPGYVHSAAFAEVAESIHFGLEALGHDSVITAEGALPGRRHIVLGTNLLPHAGMRLAPDAILYNLEQVEPGSPWFPQQSLDVLRSFAVWDYSARNAHVLERLGVEVSRVVPIGYAPQLSRIVPAAERDIDVLFVGSMNARRNQALEAMKAAGLNVVAVFGVYGAARDALIGRSKLVLNVHYYESKVLEMVRISYLLANRCAVLSEHSSDGDEDAALGDGLAFADYAALAGRARELVDSPKQRGAIAERGFEIMRSRPSAGYLHAALGEEG